MFGSMEVLHLRKRFLDKNEMAFSTHCQRNNELISQQLMISGTVHITWVISGALAWMLGMKEDDYKAHGGYQACLPGEEELRIKIGEGKLRRQETQDSAFSDEPIIR